MWSQALQILEGGCEGRHPLDCSYFRLESFLGTDGGQVLRLLDVWHDPRKPTIFQSETWHCPKGNPWQKKRFTESQILSILREAEGELTVTEGDTHQTKISVNATKKVYSPLGASIFESRLVILCDKPSSKAEAAFNSFKQEFAEQYARGQIHVLDCRCRQTPVSRRYTTAAERQTDIHKGNRKWG